MESDSDTMTGKESDSSCSSLHLTNMNASAAAAWSFINQEQTWMHSGKWRENVAKAFSESGAPLAHRPGIQAPMTPEAIVRAEASSTCPLIRLQPPDLTF